MQPRNRRKRDSPGACGIDFVERSSERVIFGPRLRRDAATHKWLDLRTKLKDTTVRDEEIPDVIMGVCCPNQRSRQLDTRPDGCSISDGSRGIRLECLTILLNRSARGAKGICRVWCLECR